MTTRKNSVVVFYPHPGVVENAFMESLISVLTYDAGRENLIANVKGCEGLYIADLRDLAARTFMRMRLCGNCRTELDKQGGCSQCNAVPESTVTPDWFWTLDTDIVFSPDTLEKLLACADPVERPIMSALYFGYVSSGNALVPVWYGRELDGRIVNLKKFSSGVQQLGVVGMGCCLIHRSVFETFGTKYAHTGWLYFGHDLAPWVPLASVDNDFMPFGEDNCFCHRANQLGIPVHGNGSVVVEHRKKRYESLQTFLASFAQGKVETDENGTTLQMKREAPPQAVRAPEHRVELVDAENVLEVRNGISSDVRVLQSTSRTEIGSAT